MTPEQLQALRVRIMQLKDQAEMLSANVVMLDRNMRDLARELHMLWAQAQGKSDRY